MAKQNYNVVLKSTQFLVDDPQYVKINDVALNKLADNYASQQLAIDDWSLEIFPNDPEVKAPFLIVGNAINYAFSRFSDGTKWSSTSGQGLKSWSGAFGMWASLHKALKEGIPVLNPNYLTQVDKDDIQKIFAGNIEIPMVTSRAENLRLLGEYVENSFNSSFQNLIDTAENKLFTRDSYGLVDLLKGTLAYEDIVRIDNKTLTFDKRSQLAAGMLIGSGLFPADDTDMLTVFADYYLPNELRHQGILEYNEDLAAKIDSKKPIKASSREEAEIRASTVHAADKLIKRINKIRDDVNPVNALHIDLKLFIDGRGRKKKGTEKFPHHLSETTAY